MVGFWKVMGMAPRDLGSSSLPPNVTSSLSEKLTYLLHSVLCEDR